MSRAAGSLVAIVFFLLIAYSAAPPPQVLFVDVTAEGTVQIRFHGACIGCPSSTMTLKQGLERNLKEKIPEVREVIPV